MTGDRLIRALTTCAVLVVAAIAAELSKIKQLLRQLLHG